MVYIIVGLAAAAGLLVYFFVIRKRTHKPQPPQPQPLQPSLKLLNINGAVSMWPAEFLTIEYVVLNGNGNEIVNWYVEHDPSVPIGSPDLACLYVLGNRLSAYAPGTRKVYAMFASNPTVRVAEFTATVKTLMSVVSK